MGSASACQNRIEQGAQTSTATLPGTPPQSARKCCAVGIAGNRVAGLHFPGYFMDMAWPRVASDTVQLALADGPHCRDANGAVDIAALAILADSALATTVRTQIVPGARLATLHLQMQFTGAPATGDISAQAHLLGFSAGGALRRSLSAATLFANGKPSCHASGEFAAPRPAARRKDGSFAVAARATAAGRAA